MRARNIKPGFFENEQLAELDPLARILFAGLWCYADREGRFEWRPKRIKALILPYDDVDPECLLHVLYMSGHIKKYVVNGSEYGCIPTFHLHQNPHSHEVKSKIPEPNQCLDMSDTSTLHVPDKAGSRPADSLIPESIYKPPIVPLEKTSPPTKPKPEKEKFIDYVFLTPEEYERLKADYGSENRDALIAELDNYIGSNPKQRSKKYTDHNRVLRGWVAEKLGLKKPNGTPHDEGPDYEPGIGRVF